MKYGVVCGRFQVPELHNGHTQLLLWAKANSHKLIVCVGVSKGLPTEKDPLDYYLREQAIKEVVGDEALIIPIEDEQSDTYWSEKFDTLIGQLTLGNKVTVYYGREGDLDRYTGKYTKEAAPIKCDDSGTKVRQTVNYTHNKDFRSGVIHNHTNRFAIAYPTVDIAVVRDNKLLLGSKPNTNLLRLPGGFVDVQDTCFLRAAQRELGEETGLHYHMYDFEYVLNMQIDDWRYVNSKDKVFTTVYYVNDVTNDIAKAGDDLATLQWVSIQDISNDRVTNIEPAHTHLIAAAILHHNQKLMYKSCQ